MRFLGRVLCAALAVLALCGVARADDRVDAVASTFAMHPVTVLCPADDPAWEFAWGYVWLVEHDEIYITPYLCDALADVNDDGFGLSRRALAILVLTHESYHQRLSWGSRGDEARTECKAIRHFRVAAMLLGASPELATRLRVYALQWHWRLAARIPEYNLAGCKVPKP